MDWQVPPVSRSGDAQGVRFTPGQDIVSFVFLHPTEGLQRRDVAPADAATFKPEGQLLGWWRGKAAEESADAASRKQVLLTTESLFLALAEPAHLGEGFGPVPDVTVDEALRDALKYLLAIMLERRRILRAVTRPKTGQPQTYLHVKSKKNFTVNWVSLDGPTVERLQTQLAALV